MANLLFILTTYLLLVGFFVLSSYENRRGVRLFSGFRTRLDQDVRKIELILEHVDLGAFLLDELRRLIARLGHDIAHLSLLVVRAAERLLTRTVRHFRTKHAVDVVPRESTRGYVKTLSDFKDRLKATRPDIPDIQ